MFTHLHGHSTFSFLEAIGKPVDIVQRAKELGMNALAITDLGGMSSAIRLYESARSAGITPILGVELGFVMDIATFKPHMEIGNICLLAQTSEGYLNLIKLVSYANTKGVEKQAKVDLNILQEYAKGIVVFFGGDQSWIGKNIMKNVSEGQTTELLEKFIAIFGKESVFLEVVSQRYSDIPDLKKINDGILHFADKLSIGVIVNNVYKYILQEDKETWEIALAVKDGKKIYDESRRKPKGDFYLQTEEEIIATCVENGFSSEQVSAWIDNNNAIADATDVEISMHQALFPVHQTPPEMEEKYNAVKDILIEKG